MGKLKLRVVELGVKEMLTRAELKSVLGGQGPSGGVPPTQYQLCMASCQAEYYDPSITFNPVLLECECRCGPNNQC